MPLPPARGDRAEPAPSRAPKKPTAFRIWRSRRKQRPPPPACGVFVPHPPPEALEVVVGGHVAPDCQTFVLHREESQLLDTTSAIPGPFPMEPGMFKKSRAQPPEENRRKPVLGKLGTLFAAGRRRSGRSGVESPSGSHAKAASPKDGTSSKPPERESDKSQPQGSQPKQRDPGEEAPPQERPPAREPGGPSDSRVRAAPPDAGRAPCASGRGAAGPRGPGRDAPQLEPREAEGGSVPGAAKQLPSPLESPSGQGRAEARAGGPGEGAPRGAGGEQEAAPGAGAAAGAPPGCAEAGGGPGAAAGAAADGGAGPRRGPGERARPAALTLVVSPGAGEGAGAGEGEGEGAAPGPDDCGDPDDMERRSCGRRAGRRRRSQRSAESPGPDAAPPDSAGGDGPGSGCERAPDAAGSGDSPAGPDPGVAAAAGAEAKAGPGARGQPRGEAERGPAPPPPPPAASPAKRRGRSRGPEAAPAGEPPEDRADGAARGGPRELTVKSATLLPEIRPEHKRGLAPGHPDGRGREPGRPAAAPDADGGKPRNHLGAGRSTVTTKVTLPAKPKHVELNLKTPKNPDSSGNEHNPFSQPVHKGNTANKISLFENKRANSSSPRHADVRSTRNPPASCNKTFVGRAKLNLAKKAKEMEQSEKKVLPNSHQNGMLAKETSTESKVTEEEIPPAAGSPSAGGSGGQPPQGQAPGPPLHPSARAEVHTDAGCPPEAVAAALNPVEDHEASGEDDSKAAGSKRLALENMTDPAQDIPATLDTKEPPPAAAPKPQDTLSDSQPPAESSNGPSPSQPAPKGACVRAPISSLPRTDLKASENHNGCVLPPPHKNDGAVQPSKLEGGGGAAARPPPSAEHGPEAVGPECPSTVLVHVRSFMLPVESTHDAGAQVISEGPEVRGAQLPSCQNDPLEVVSVASCAPPKEEGPGREGTAPKPGHRSEEPAAEPGPQVTLPESGEHLRPATLQGDPSVGSPPGGAPGPHASAASGPDSPASLGSGPAGGDDNLLDSSSDMEKFTEIIKNMDSTACVPQKKKKARVPSCPAPPFVMPPIHEDHLEKVLDPNVFTCGLGKKKDSPPEMSPALHLMQNLYTKSNLRSKRTSTEQSVPFGLSVLDPDGKAEPPTGPETEDKENRDVPSGGVKRSRLEKSALFSSMLPSAQDRVFSPSVTSVSTMSTCFGAARSSGSLARPPRPGAEGAPPCRADQERPSLPPGSLKVFGFDATNASLPGLKSPGYMEKYLPREETKEDPGSRSNGHLPEAKLSEFPKPKTGSDRAESVLKSSLPNPGHSDADFMGLFKSSRFDPNVSFSAMSLSDATTLRGSLTNKINPRPGKVVIYRDPDVSEECIEIFSDIEDCSSWSLSPVVIIKVVRGCWILYEKPNFEGHSIPLEEGELELSGLWGIEDILEGNEEAESTKPVVIGSIRHVVQDYRVSQIDLFTEPEGLGLLNSYFDDTEEMQGFGIMQKTCSIKVHWGTWLIYEEPGFQGVPFVLEPGEYPDLSFWDTEEAYIGSMRPLKMGGRKVEFPTDPKVVIYEKPFFEGKCMELETEMCSFITEAGETEETTDDSSSFTSVGSMKVLRGIWVAYEKPGFTGHQYLLEEGEYKDWKDWGGYNGELQSLRPILGDFSNAHMIMYSEKNFGSKGSSIDVLGIVANLKETGYGLKTQSINVLSGVWVAYENPDFTGEQYILDKGFYTSFEDWGGKNCKISSVQPICLDSFTGPRRRNQIQLFSEPEFQGRSQGFEETTSQIDDSFSTKSCRVLGGSWVAYDGENFSGNQYVLEEGHYPCLSAMGCLPGATFKSLRFIDAEFSEPTIILFEREDFKGKKIELNAEVVNLRSLGFNTQIRSVQVIGGIWVTYEYGNYRGRQFLLSPAEVPNWYEFSGCRQIGSLRPFVQKRIYFRLRNKATGLFMSTNGNLEDLKLLRIQVMEDVGADDQIWIYQEGCIKCRIAEDCCLTIVGSLVTSGSKLGLALDQNADSQFWSMKSDGRIYSKLKPNLVLDVKGGTHYDQNHIILNTVSNEKLTQVWEAMVL
uniref:Crystallin beta-gamma domain containing 1 n=1 Tax=Canis lupus dingo TaxID=286419 RepID=A0A8C0R2Y1_CANLU